MNIQIIHWYDGKTQIRLVHDQDNRLVTSVVGNNTAEALLLLTKVFDDDFID